MFFTRIGTIIAHLAFWVGLLGFATALLLIFGPEFQTDDGQIVFKNLGKKLDSGAKFIVIGVALGVMCEISKKLSGPSA